MAGAASKPEAKLSWLRYADAIVVGFEHEWEARRFLAVLSERMEQFDLKLHPEKTRLLEFGRHAAARRARRGLGKPETFNYLGFTHLCGRRRQGNFLLMGQTRRDRMRAKLRELKAELRKRMHQPIPVVGRWLQQVVRGYFQYHAVPTNSSRLAAFRFFVGRDYGGAHSGVAASATASARSDSPAW